MADASDAERLYLSCQLQVRRYLTRLVGNSETARDLAQETFLRATRGTSPSDEPARRAWVFRIARNLALNHMRDASRHASNASEAAGPAGRGATQETSLVVREALGQLADLDREVFLLRESAGLNYAEIAESCGITDDAVRSRLQRARQELRVLLEGALASERARGIRLSRRNSE
jgi:RNA polymerase sigma-70 factor (ECF subfamily)